ncbi:hypothetical protein AVEN_77745-1 [Araneus ventricosus]|uniref:Single-stranded DNA-binding protein 3 n=1 Tax=Araneus ventricosus TaxID=182803 RepID=A0A4Y2IKB1_ARAVE|nr:hypothetical protein AVEN_77745-1 [Araneus ventricosus]
MSVLLPIYRLPTKVPYHPFNYRMAAATFLRVVSGHGPPGMNPMNPRMSAPRGQPLPMNPGSQWRNEGLERGSDAQFATIWGRLGDNIYAFILSFQCQRPGGPGGRPWQPNTSTMNYSSASPGSHYGGPPVSSTGPPGPGTPIMPSPQGSSGPYSPASHRMNTSTPRRDSTSSGGESMYAMMKPVPGGSIPGFPMGPGPEGPIGSMGPEMGPPVMNGMSSADTFEDQSVDRANQRYDGVLRTLVKTIMSRWRLLTGDQVFV